MSITFKSRYMIDEDPSQAGAASDTDLNILRYRQLKYSSQKPLILTLGSCTCFALVVLIFQYPVFYFAKGTTSAKLNPHILPSLFRYPVSVNRPLLPSIRR